MRYTREQILVPPSGGSLEIGNDCPKIGLEGLEKEVPPSGGSLEIGNLEWGVCCDAPRERSPFGGIPRNWKLFGFVLFNLYRFLSVPPSGGSLEIGNICSFVYLAIINLPFPLRGDP